MSCWRSLFKKHVFVHRGNPCGTACKSGRLKRVQYHIGIRTLDARRMFREQTAVLLVIIQDDLVCSSSNYSYRTLWSPRSSHVMTPCSHRLPWSYMVIVTVPTGMFITYDYQKWRSSATTTYARHTGWQILISAQHTWWAHAMWSSYFPIIHGRNASRHLQYICIHVRIYICIYIYIYTHIHLLTAHPDDTWP